MKLTGIRASVKGVCGTQLVCVLPLRRQWQPLWGVYSLASLERRRWTPTFGTRLWSQHAAARSDRLKRWGKSLTPATPAISRLVSHFRKDLENIFIGEGLYLGMKGWDLPVLGTVQSQGLAGGLGRQVFSNNGSTAIVCRGSGGDTCGHC